MRSQKVFGSYGRFYEQIPSVATAFNIGNFHQEVVFYDQNPIENPNAPTVGDTLVFSAGGTQKITAADLNGQYFDEFALGYERRLGAKWKFGLRGIHRELRSVVEDSFTDPATGEITWGNPGRNELAYLPGPTRIYSALEFTVDRVYAGDYQLSATYVLSRAFGNAPGVFDSDSGNSHANGTNQYWTPEQLVNAYGRLPNDRPHNFKVYGARTFGFGLTAGAFFMAQSGTPLNEYGATSLAGPTYSHVVPRGTAGRADWLWDLNLRLAYDLSRLAGRGSRVRPRLLLDVFHLFGQETPVLTDQVRFFSLDENGNQTDPNPRFGQVLAYQPPMTLRMGMEISF